MTEKPAAAGFCVCMSGDQGSKDFSIRTYSRCGWCHQRGIKEDKPEFFIQLNGGLKICGGFQIALVTFRSGKFQKRLKGDFFARPLPRRREEEIYIFCNSAVFLSPPARPETPPPPRISPSISMTQYAARGWL